MVRLDAAIARPGEAVSARAAACSGCLGAAVLTRAAGLLDRRDRALRGAGDFEGELRLEFALAEDLHAVARLGDSTPAAISASIVTGCARVELAGVDRLLDAAEVDLVVVDARTGC